MKISALIIAFWLSACNVMLHDKTQFRNPIFYQPLRPLSKTATWTYLTPMSYSAMAPSDKDRIATQGKCDLLENNENRIMLKCQIEMWGKTYVQYYIFVIEEMFLPNCLRVVQYSYDKPENFPKFASQSSFCVTPLKNTISESD